jgi:hypothetical protein
VACCASLTTERDAGEGYCKHEKGHAVPRIFDNIALPLLPTLQKNPGTTSMSMGISQSMSRSFKTLPTGRLYRKHMERD